MHLMSAGWALGFLAALLAYTLMTGSSVKALAAQYCESMSLNGYNNLGAKSAGCMVDRGDL